MTFLNVVGIIAVIVALNAIHRYRMNKKWGELSPYYKHPFEKRCKVDKTRYCCNYFEILDNGGWRNRNPTDCCRYQDQIQAAYQIGNNERIKFPPVTGPRMKTPLLPMYREQKRKEIIANEVSENKGKDFK